MKYIPDVPSRLPAKNLLLNHGSVRLLLLVACFMLLTSCDAPTNNLATDSEISDNPTNHPPTDNDISDVPANTPATGTDGDDLDMKESVVSTAFELHLDEYDVCRMDIRLPNLNNHLPNAGQMNELIHSEYRYLLALRDINDCETAEGYEYVWYQYDYAVADFDGIYGIAIISTISSAYGSYSPWKHVRSFYYDANQGEMLSVGQFMDRIGYSEDDIIHAYINSCCPAYTPDQIDFSQIPFYFDEYKELNFFFSLIESITSHTFS